jgi:hypothetical protein
MSDVIVPQYHQRVAKGEVFFNPMVKTSLERSYSGSQGHRQKYNTPIAPCMQFRRYEGFGDYIGNAVAALVGDSPTVTPPASNDAVIRDLRSEVSTTVLGNRGIGESNLWESLAEYKQTVDMFSDVHGRFAARFEDLKNDIRGGFDPRKRFSLKHLPFRAAGWTISSWLAYRYGISPLLRDIQTVFEAAHKKSRHMRVTTRAHREVDLTSSVSFQVASQGSLRTTIMRLLTDRVEVRAMTLDDVMIGWPEHLGLTVKGLVTVPWDLITLSFVADHFVNVGDFLRSFAPTPGWTMLGGSVVVTRESRETYTSMGDTWNTSAAFTVERPITGTVDVKLVTKTRSPSVVPGLVVRQDFFGKHPGVRVADWFALSAQKLRQFDQVYLRAKPGDLVSTYGVLRRV